MTDKADLNKLLDDWRDPYGARTVTLASDLIDALLRERHNFVEQACETIDEIGSTPLTYNIDIPEEEDIISGYMQGRSEAYNEIKQAILDKFK